MADIGDRFDVKQDRADRILRGEMVEIVFDAQMHAIADRDDGGERQGAIVGLGDDLFSQCARLRDQCDAVARARSDARRHVAQEGGGEAPGGIEMDQPGAVGAGDEQIVFGGDGARLRVARAAGFSRLGEAAGQDQQIAMTAGGGFAQRVGDGVGTDHDHDQIARLGDLRQRMRGGVTEYLAALGIDRHDPTLVAGDLQHLHDGAAGRGGAFAGADHGDAAGREEGVQAVAVHGPIRTDGIRRR